MTIRGNLKEMFRSKSMDEGLSKVLRSERKSLGSEIIRLRDSPKRLFSERMAAIEVRIQRIKSLSPLRSGSKSVCDVSGLVDERDSAEGDGVVKKAGHNGLEGGGQSGPKKTLEGVKRVAASDVKGDKLQKTSEIRAGVPETGVVSEMLKNESDGEKSYSDVVGTEMESKNADEKDVSKKPSCPIATSKERGLPAPSPVRSSPEEIVAPEVSKEVSPFPLVVSGVEVIDSEEGSEEEETSDEESSESQGNAASSFRDSSKTCLFVPESDCVIDAHFGIGLDFVDVGKLDDSVNQGKQSVGLGNQAHQVFDEKSEPHLGSFLREGLASMVVQAPCSESVLVVGSDSKGSSGSQTGGKLEEHKASVQPVGASSWASIVASKGDPKQPIPRLNHRSPVGKLEYVEPKELGRQLEKIAVRALNQAKQGSKPLSKDDFTYFETWLAKYRATSSQSIPLVTKTSKAVTAGKEEIFVEWTEEVKEYGANIDIEDEIAACDNSPSNPNSGRAPDRGRVAR
ncbi:hypothetical protein U1Q18_032643 [Sarracenia purpurea var. burkii]